MGKPKRAETAKREGCGALTERWAFDDDIPAHRCAWPTADAARAIADDPSESMGARRIASAYIWLAAHPLGVEYAVRHVRDLNRAERRGGFMPRRE